MPKRHADMDDLPILKRKRKPPAGRINAHVLYALRWAARQPCHRKDCGTVCLCGPCHARKALPAFENRERAHYRRKAK